MGKMVVMICFIENVGFFLAYVFNSVKYLHFVPGRLGCSPTLTQLTRSCYQQSMLLSIDET